MAPKKTPKTPLDFSTFTLKDALDLAGLIEEEAEERYRSFVEMLGHRYGGDAGHFFEKMAENEKKHGEQIRQKRQQQFGSAPCEVDHSMIWDVEAPGFGSPRSYMSVHQAVKVALESEIKAHDFFVEALKSIKDTQVKALFEKLRDEELEHKRALLKFQQTLGPDIDPDPDDDDLDELPAL